jgi:hypothetical protein
MQDGLVQCPRTAQNETRCSCPKTACENHGVCCECIVAHKKREDGDNLKRFPHCLRSLVQEVVNHNDASGLVGRGHPTP